MKYLKDHWILDLLILFLCSLLLISCSGGKNTKYRDTSHLEKPPSIPIIEKPKKLVEESDESVGKGLGDIVLLTEIEQKPVIKIKKTFERSWDIVEQALLLKEIEISDKNRDAGVFYVNFDPDKQSDTSMFDTMTFFFFKDEYEEAAYKLTVVWKESDSEVTVQPVNSEEIDLLDDNEDDDFEGAIDEGVMLINTIYKTIRDELETGIE